MSGQISLLLVDDEALVLDMLSQWFVVRGYDVTAVSSPDAAEAFLSRTTVDVVLVDQGFPGGGGRELVEFLSKLPARPGIVVLSGRTDPAYIAQVMESGADDYLVKPGTMTGIQAAVEFVVAARSKTAVRENQ